MVLGGLQSVLPGHNGREEERGSLGLAQRQFIVPSPVTSETSGIHVLPASLSDNSPCEDNGK